MLKKFINKIHKYTGVLIRIDDVAENMNWSIMDKCESLFDKNNIKPLVGVIPKNKDPDLLKFSKNNGFWERVNSWQNKGWEISMHGMSHVYSQYSNKKDIFNYGGNSEFYNLDFKTQSKMISSGIKIFNDKKVKVRSFFAPNHIYDQNTLKALSENKIKIVIDGYGLFPFLKDEILFIPQLFYRELFLPFGIQSTQIHLNNWENNHFLNFEKLIDKHLSKIVNLDYILKLDRPNLFKDTINLLVETSLKTARVFK